ncbi:hypothetical protein H696_01463 [Fonticula alba]|uniref:Uncharacterized protein n=1 Tax=Fonticula alba TaxID=691883 RepID=A0A058ZCE7_FONAL|nr:hypothetical protein H696_01463 [Fonticula alba]KCV72054.1 hypothetical protein H696_01463 [Fonticula alba]|eukprot:XP_009493632.1 hypothetical protein H696_01463 [Fonticula alba]
MSAGLLSQVAGRSPLEFALAIGHGAPPGVVVSSNSTHIGPDAVVSLLEVPSGAPLGTFGPLLVDPGCVSVLRVPLAMPLATLVPETAGAPAPTPQMPPCFLAAAPLVAISSHNRIMQAWRWDRQAPVDRAIGPERLACLARSPCGAWTVAGGASGRLYLWDSGTGALVQSWDAHYARVTCIQWTDDSLGFVSGSDDSSVFAWSLVGVFNAIARNAVGAGAADEASVPPRHAWSSQHSLPISAVALTPGGLNSARVLSASHDKTLKMWDLATGALLFTYNLPSVALSLVFEPSTGAVWAGCHDGHIYRVILARGVSLASDGDGGATGGLTDATGSWAAGSAEGDLRVALTVHKAPVTALAVSLDGAFLASGSQDGVLLLWDLVSRQVVRSLPQRPGPVNFLQLLPRPEAEALALATCARPTPERLAGAGGAGSSHAGGGNAAALAAPQVRRHVALPPVSVPGSREEDLAGWVVHAPVAGHSPGPAGAALPLEPLWWEDRTTAALLLAGRPGPAAVADKQPTPAAPVAAAAQPEELLELQTQNETLRADVQYLTEINEKLIAMLEAATGGPAATAADE